MLTSRNPYTGQINAQIPKRNDQQLQTALQQAADAYHTRKSTPLTDKKTLFLRLTDILEQKRDEHALLETQEMGSLYHFSQKVITGTIALIRRYANNAASVLADEPFDHGNGLHGHIQYDSLGVIYGIAPRNFPHNQLLRAAVPNLLAGNTVVYKHASNVPLCAAAIEQLFIDAGFPTGVYTNLPISASQSELILAHPAVQGVNLTGSEAAGAAIGALAGKHLKRSILELGGNDAFLLLDHKDTDHMAAKATACRISNGGQRCNASKRFIILEQHYDTFVQQLAKHMADLAVGDPMDPATQVPPMARTDLLQEIHQQVQQTLAQGATLLTGGNIIDTNRNLYAPTVLTDCQPGMTSREQEVFGPVASVIKAKDIEHAIALANASEFGLSATVFGDNITQCQEVARRLEWWMIFINQPAGSKASLPFGGTKKSGYGKENGPDGLLAFTNKKIVVY